MYVDGAYFDPNNTVQEGQVDEDGSSQTHEPNPTPSNFPMEDLPHHQNPQGQTFSSLEIELQQLLSIGNENMSFSRYSQHQDQNLNHVGAQNGSSVPDTNPPTPNLLNLFHLPNSSSSLLPPNHSISFANANNGQAISGGFYDPLLPLNLQPRAPIFMELIQSLQHGYNLTGSTVGSSLNGLVDEGAGSGGVYQYGDNGELEFSREMKGRDGKVNIEKKRRVDMNDRYQALRILVPSPTKNDRASIIGDAIEYIKELLRTVDELKILVEKKKCARERIKRQKTEDEFGEVESTNMKSYGCQDHLYNGTSLRSSWLQRKTKNAEVDVRIVGDEVTIKLVQPKTTNCLLFVSKVLDELHLDLNHVAGGLIGDSYSFLFNTRIYEGSIVYASTIANELIEAVDA